MKTIKSLFTLLSLMFVINVSGQTITYSTFAGYKNVNDGQVCPSIGWYATTDYTMRPQSITINNSSYSYFSGSIGVTKTYTTSPYNDSLVISLTYSLQTGNSIHAWIDSLTGVNIASQTAPRVGTGTYTIAINPKPYHTVAFMIGTSTNSNNTAQMSNVQINFINNISSTGIKQYIEDISDLTVYPNPSNGEFDVRFNSKNDKCEVQVYNLLGHLVLSDNSSNIGENTMHINLTNQPPGIYFIRVNNQSLKIIKQ